MKRQEIHSINNSVKRKNSKSTNTSTQSIKMKNSNYIEYTEEDYVRGLETLNLPMKTLLDTLKYNPKVLFVELNLIGENYSTNESVYKTRNKSTVKFLSPIEVEQKAVHDIEFMCNTIQKMVLASGKVITSGIQPVQAVNVTATVLVNCKTCKATFSKRSDLVNHIDSRHPDVPLQCCTFCDKKFLMLRGLAQHISMSHATISRENKSKNSCDSNEISIKCNESLYSLTNSDNLHYSSIKNRNIDSASLSLNSRKKLKYSIPMISSLPIKNECLIKNEETNNTSNFRVSVILPKDQYGIQKAVFKPENNDSHDPDKNPYFIFSSGNNLERKTLQKKKSKVVKYVDVKTDISMEKNNVLLVSSCTTKETRESKHTVKDDALSELNSIKNKADVDNVINSENQKKMFTKFGMQEIMPLISQNGEKTDTKAMSVDDNIFSDKICCICLDIINVTRQIFDKQQNSKFKCHECPFCGVRYADMYFEHHVATVHLICDEEECKSRVILTGRKLRELLTMRMKMECIHVNCNHNSLIDLKNTDSDLYRATFKDDHTSNSVDNLKNMSVSVNNKNEAKRQECDTTENNIENDQLKYFSEDLKVCLKNSEYFDREQGKIKLIPKKCSDSNIKFAFKAEPCDSVKEEHDIKRNECVRYTDSLSFDIHSSITEENKVSSSNDYLHEISSQKSGFDESIEAIIVESSESSLCCCVCKETFHQEQKLLAHLFNYHRFSHPFTCDICFLCYRHIIDLQSHMQVHRKQMILKKIKSNTEEEVSFQKWSLSDESSAFEYYLKEKPYLAESIRAQDLQAEKSDIKKIKLKLDDVPSHFQNEQKDSPTKKKKLKISCVVEKVEYPLDIHNLYAHIRKAEDPKVVNSMELGLQSDPLREFNNTNLLSFEVNKTPVDSNTSSLNKTAIRRKLSTSSSIPTKKVKKDHCQVHTDSATDEVKFQCKTCEKTFDFKRSYSEHMFFMHDAVFDDSVVCDLLKPSSRENKNIKNTLQKTENRINTCTNAEFPHPTETHVKIDDFDKIKAYLMHPGSSEKLEKNLTDEVMNNSRNCSQCGKRYVQVTSYFQHRYDIHGDDSLVHVCDNCSKVLITVNMVNSHLCTHVDTFSCKDCGINFVNGLALKEHNTMTHFESVGPHVCHDCKKCFLTNRMKQKHKRVIHSDVRDINSAKREKKNKSAKLDGLRANITNRVEKFERSFVNENFLRKSRAVNSIKPFSNKNGKINSLTCPVCKFVLQSTRRLQAHLMVNHSKVTDLCLLCNRLFAFGRGIRHMLDFHIIPTHNKNKEYELSWEGDPRKDVKEAIEVLGEKRLLAICSYEDYVTLTDSALFQCRLCLMTYSAVRYYRTHYVQRHDKFCALCGQSFESNKDFTLHVEDVHNSLKHYLWFTETIISTILQTERSKENSSETFLQIIGRKLDENEVNTASQLLERMEDERISANSIYSEKSQLADTTCDMSVSNSELPELPIELPLSEYEIPDEDYEVPIVASVLPVAKSEPSTELYTEDVLELPDFCMEYEITDSGTIITQNPNYYSNEILVNSINDEKECTERDKERKKPKNSIMSVRSFDVSNCVFENSMSVNNRSIVNLKDNEMTVIASCPADSEVSLENFAKDISLKKNEERNSIAVGINSDVNHEKVALVVTEEDLRIYRNNIQALAERLSSTCNELSVGEIVETLQAYVISQS